MTNSAKRRPSIEAQAFLIIDLGFAAAIVVSVFLVIFGPGLARAAFAGAPFSLVADTESGLTAVAGARCCPDRDPGSAVRGQVTRRTRAHRTLRGTDHAPGPAVGGGHLWMARKRAKLLNQLNQ